MLGKKYRVPIQKFPRKAKSVYSGKLFLVKKSSNTLTYSRVGVIVGKGIIKKAVKRNKVRRIVMNAFRDNEKILQAPGFDYLVIINSSDKLDGEEHGKLIEELKGGLAKL